MNQISQNLKLQRRHFRRLSSFFWVDNDKRLLKTTTRRTDISFNPRNFAPFTNLRVNFEGLSYLLSKSNNFPAENGTEISRSTFAKQRTRGLTKFG